jgi:hypothetical protein
MSSNGFFARSRCQIAEYAMFLHKVVHPFYHVDGSGGDPAIIAGDAFQQPDKNPDGLDVDTERLWKTFPGRID